MLKRVIDSLQDDSFCKDEPSIFDPIVQTLLEQGDTYLHLADFRSFIEASARIDELYLKPEEWAKKALINVARIGKFSSDRTIREYANQIWEIEPTSVKLH